MSNLYTFPPQKTAKLNVPDDEPIYRVTGSGFFDGAQLLQEYDELGRPTLIAYDGEPNFNLLPMNEKAMAITEAWLKKLKEGADECRKHPDYNIVGGGGFRTGVMSQEVTISRYMAAIKDSGRFEPKRVEAAILSNKVNKATARVIEHVVVDTPEIKSVSAKKKQQTEMLNG